MSKKAAVLAVNPVNGSGLFQYLEAIYENGVGYEVFAAAPSRDIKTNSGIPLTANGTVAELKERTGDFDALIFACGDAMPVFGQNADKQYNTDMIEVIRLFAGEKKIMAGHCAAALAFEIAGVDAGVRMAAHPLAAPAIKNGIATGEAGTHDGNFYTARDENDIREILPALLRELK